MRTRELSARHLGNHTPKSREAVPAGDQVGEPSCLANRGRHNPAPRSVSPQDALNQILCCFLDIDTLAAANTSRHEHDSATKERKVDTRSPANLGDWL